MNPVGIRYTYYVSNENVLLRTCVSAYVDLYLSLQYLRTHLRTSE